MPDETSRRAPGSIATWRSRGPTLPVRIVHRAGGGRLTIPKKSCNVTSMGSFAARTIQWLADWRRFVALLVVLFLARALFLISILPPFEGWDEYQHIAYIQFLVENDREPVLHQDVVPRSLFGELVKYPHCFFGVDQVKRIGGVTYEQFRAEGPPAAPRADARDLPLYQAQQPPLYYRLVAPLHQRLMSAGGILASVTGLRLLNVLFGAAAVAVAAISAGSLLKPGAHRYIVGLLIATQPLYLVNCVRVANDALAVLLGTIAVSCVLHLPRARRPWLMLLLGGASLGGAILAKTNLLGLLPFVPLAFAFLYWRKRISLPRAAGGLALVLLLTAACTFSYFRGNLRQYGMLTPLQEAVKNDARGRGAGDLAKAAIEIDWRRQFFMRLFRQSLWWGGWSMLAPQSPILGVQYPLVTHGGIIVIAGAAGFIACLRGPWRRRTVLAESGVGTVLVLLGGAMTAALSYHALHSQMAAGNIGTNAWYGAVIFPWLILLIYAGLAKLPGRVTAGILAAVMLLNQFLVEAHGSLVVMMKVYYGGGWSVESREHLNSMHPAMLGATVTLPCLALASLMVILGLTAWCGAALRTTPESLDGRASAAVGRERI